MSSQPEKANQPEKSKRKQINPSEKQLFKKAKKVIPKITTKAIVNEAAKSLASLSQSIASITQSAPSASAAQVVSVAQVVSAIPAQPIQAASVMPAQPIHVSPVFVMPASVMPASVMPAPASASQFQKSPTNIILQFILNEKLIDIIKAFITAAAQGKLDILKYFVESFYIVRETQEYNENTLVRAFCEACKNDKKDCMEYLLHLVCTFIKNANGSFENALCLTYSNLLNKEAFSYLIDRCEKKFIVDVVRNNKGNVILNLENVKKLVEKNYTNLYYGIKLNNLNEEVIFYLLSLEKREKPLRDMLFHLYNTVDLNDKIYANLRNQYNIIAGVNLNLITISDYNFNFIARHESTDISIRRAIVDLYHKRKLSKNKAIIVFNIASENKKKSEINAVM